MLNRLSFGAGERVVLLFFVVAVLWRGGKGLEATWLLTGLALFLCGLECLHWLRETSGAHRSKHSLPLSMWVLALLLIILTTLSYITSSAQNYGLDEVLQTASYVFIFLWLLRRKQQSTVLEHGFPFALAAAALIASVFGIAVYILQPVDRFVGTFFDMRFHTDYWPNAWADFVLIAWPVLLFLITRLRVRWQKISTVCLLALVLATLFLSYSRGAILACAAQWALLLGVFSYYALQHRQRFGSAVRSSWKLLPSVAGVFLIMVVLFYGSNALRRHFFPVQSVIAKATFTASEGTSSISERSSFWKQAARLTLNKPLLGWGPYSFRFVEPQYMEGVLATSDHPHNMLLKFAMERGIATMFVFMALCATVFIFSLCHFSRSHLSIVQDPCFATITYGTALFGLFLHSMIDYNLQFVGIGMGAVILLALLYRHIGQMPRPAVSFTRWKITRYLWKVEMVLVILLAMTAFWEGGFLVISSLGRHAQAANDPEKALAWYERSRFELFSRDLLLSKAELEKRAENTAKASQSIEAYIRRNAFDPRGWQLKSEIDKQSGDADALLRDASRAYAYGRYTNVHIVSLYVEALLKASMKERLTVERRAIDELFIAYADAIRQNAHFIALSDNPEGLQVLSRLLSRTFPLEGDAYTGRAQNALSHARIERERYTFRRSGILW